MKYGKKAFTIVEVIVALAVIAILAAVLIPAYTSLVQKASLLADEQTVKNMNTALATYQILYDAPSDSDGAISFLAESGFDVCMKPKTENCAFYLISGENRVVLVKLANDGRTPEKIIFGAYPPDKYENNLPSGREWLNIATEDAGQIPLLVSDAWTVENGILKCDGVAYTGNSASGEGKKGFYYKDGVLADGAVGGYTFSDGMLVITDRLIEGTNVTSDGTVGKRNTIHRFNEDMIDKDYITDMLIVKLNDISSAEYAVDAKDYGILSARVVVPFHNLFRKTGWTADDRMSLINEKAKLLFDRENECLLKRNDFFYPSDLINDVGMYLPRVNFNSELTDYLNLIGYNVLRGDIDYDSAVSAYISRFGGAGKALPLTFAQYLELKYAKGINVMKMSDGTFTTGKPASLTFDSDSNRVKRGNSYAVHIKDGYIGLNLDEKGNLYLDGTATGFDKHKAFVGGEFISENGKITAFRLKHSDANVKINGRPKKLSSVYNITPDGLFSFKWTNTKSFSIKVTYTDDGAARLCMKVNNSNEAWAEWTPPVEGDTIPVGKDGTLELDAYGLTGDIVGCLDADGRKRLISEVFGTDVRTESDYVHCEPAVAEAYLKAMILSSVVNVNGTDYSYESDGTIDIMPSVKAGTNGKIVVSFPDVGRVDMPCPDAIFILAANR